MIGYRCPECAGTMRTVARLTNPPITEAKCLDCGVLYRQQRHPLDLPPLPRDYERIERTKAPDWYADKP